MSKYDFFQLQNLIKKYHNYQVLREINKTEVKKSRKNIYNRLLIKQNDTYPSIILKILFFWISNGNLERFSQSIVALPASWAIKPGDFLPQLVAIYRLKGKTRTGNYTLVIPHYTGTKTPVLPQYKKGTIRSALVLKDGSRLIVHAASEAEGARVIHFCQKYIDKKFLTKDIRHTINQRVKVGDMIPIRGDYYPSGQSGLEPLWRHYFNNS